MNSAFITIGTALIIALVAALVAPMFIDWSAYRTTFERYGETILGHNVAVLGDADVSLLPTPSIAFTDVRVGEVEDPLLVISRFSGKIELPALLRGEIRVLDMKLEEPNLRVALDEQGKLDLLNATPHDSVMEFMEPSSVVFDSIEIVNGSISLVDARSGESFSGVNGNFLASARSLEGPFKLDGAITLEGVPYTVRIGTGRRDASKHTRVKAQISPASFPAQFTLDGEVWQEDGRPFYAGTALARSILPEDSERMEWQFEGDYQFDPSALIIPAYTLRLGPEDRPVTAEGAARFDYAGDGALDASARFKQIDLDRLFGGGPQEPVSVASFPAQLTSFLEDLPLAATSTTLKAEMPSVVMGGSVLTDVRAEVSSGPTGWGVKQLSARLPGRSSLRSSGYLELRTAREYRGQVEIDSLQPQKLASWWHGTPEVATARVEPFDLRSDVAVGPGLFSMTDLRLDVDGAQTVGTVSYKWPSGQPAELVVDIDSDRLDLDQLETFAAALSGGQVRSTGLNMSLRLYADEFVSKGVKAKSMILRAGLEDDTLAIDELKIRDFAGAYVDASGRVERVSTTPSGSIDGTLRATSLIGAVSALERIAPENRFVQQLKRAAPALAPVSLTSKLEASAVDGQTQISASLYGDVGVSEFDFNGTFAGRMDEINSGDVRAELFLGGADGVTLLRQLGIEALPLDNVQQASVQLAMEGVPRSKMDFVFTGQLGDAELKSEGTFNVKPDGSPHWEASSTLRTADISPTALVLGYLLPNPDSALPVDVEATLSGEGRKFEMTSLSGVVADANFQGTLSGELSQNSGLKASGALAASSVDLRGLSELVLGSGAWTADLESRESVWPSSALGASLLSGIDLTLDLRSDRAHFSEEMVVDAASGQLRLRDDLLAIDQGVGRYAGGSLTGALQLTRVGDQASLEGRFRLDDAVLEELIWARDGRAVATGTVQAIAEFEGLGRTVSGLVSGLAGGGTFTIKSGEIRGLNPDAFDLVIEAADRGLELDETKVRDVFASHLDLGSSQFDQIDGTLALSSGRLRARNISVDTAAATMFGSAQIDLQKWQAEGDVSIKVAGDQYEVSGADPQVAIVFEGDVASPSRRIDVTPFLSYLNIRAIEQNVLRIEKEQEAIAEQERMLRELKRQQEEAEVRKRQEAEQAAQRAAEEEARRAAEREARRAAQEQAARERAYRERLERQRQEREQAEREQREREDRIRRLLQENSAPAPSSPSAQDRTNQQGADADFLSTVRSALSRGQSDTQDGGVNSDQGLPALAPPKFIGGVNEAAVPGSGVTEGQILVAPGSDFSVDGAGTTFDASVPPPQPKRDNLPRFRELPGGRLIEIN
ncbi:AsmA-like C-terminal region-containing protein [Pseudovibrio sp. SPO723]|uniref:AsmA family protein n=1 Tax=Nesiotobacter zosterae TaxID=392721 RepID=UPI0029C255BE|nr:AsmA-like C-terminal region-containing protein [Pseudovibrio sp. SPO723]MDX5594056.1 AsmA family protein [Pseudovibrio sp. SPO723]